MKALGMYVFAGSMSIGVMQAGFSVERVLELSDDMTEKNAKHFIHNYPGIPVVKPLAWSTPEYIEALRKDEYDLMYGNPPCSGLSNINRNASADNKVNQYIYKFTDMVEAIKPKVFLMENAPTLISRGKTILDYMISTLLDYKFMIIRDYAGNHKVPMKRQRTMIVGFKSDYFYGVIPKFNFEHNTITVGEFFSRLDLKNSKNNYLVPERTCKDLEVYYDSVQPGDSIMTTLANMSEDSLKCLDLSEDRLKQIHKLKEKMCSTGRAFEKSPSRLDNNKQAPSLASVIELIHPIENRPLTVREYASIMGYPESFDFVADADVPYVQAIAQGVPVNFAKWAAENIHRVLEFKQDNKEQEFYNSDIVYINACNENNMKQTLYSRNEFLSTNIL